ncbi:37S ribosomal protein S22 [Knufia obscura]|uniref:37S ribosomal protein S22 n=1 Tax=Knufia obscura TaxID=1635080 RepID=A0ABR0RC50_9EURO|nr:37S ribosomal protein S22 [Knufia obscura]
MSAGRSLRRLPKTCAASTIVHPQPTRSIHIKSTFAASRAGRNVSHVPYRSLSTANQSHQSNHTGQDDVSTSRDGSLALEEEMLAMQDAAIAELEARLGKSLQQAIEEDNLAELVRRNAENAGNVDEENYSIIESTESPLVQLRAAGSSPEEVAREARNIFGEYLPEDTLSPDELTLYKRLYGEPIPEPEIDEDKERMIAEAEDVDVDQVPKNLLFDAAGAPVDYRLENAAEIADNIEGRSTAGAAQGEGVFTDASLRLGLDQAAQLEDIATMVDGNVVDEDYEYEMDEEEETEDTRSHPLTKLGRFATFPRTTFLPQQTFTRPVEQVMSNFSNKHLKELCERTFGGPGLPDSPLTPRSGRSRQQLPIPLEARQHVMGQMEANAFMTSVMPPVYATVLATLTETRKRLGSSWLDKLLARPGGPRVLDAGSGGVGVLAWRDIINAHWSTLHTSDKNPPPAPQSKAVVLTGSDALRHRAAAMLENTTFVPRLPDYVHVRDAPTFHDARPAQQRKQFDVIIASHSLFPLKEEWERRQHVQNLWSLLSDEGGVLILIEKGIPRGFEAVAAARDMLLERYIKNPEGEKTFYSTNSALESPESEVHQKSTGMIIAPCTNHDRCPLFRTTGVSKGRKDVCSFQQRYIRPPFLQRILGAKDRNHDDVDYSYVSVLKGDDLRNRSFTKWEHVADPMAAPKEPNTGVTASHIDTASNIQQGFEHIDPTWSDSAALPPAHALPRILSHPLKRQGHVTIDLCTPQAEIRRWTIPKSFSRQAYRDARKAKWGDLWALGAKTNIARNLKTGTPQKDMARSEGMRGNLGKARSRKERLEMQAEAVAEAEQVERSEDEKEEEAFMRMIEEENLLDEADEEDLIDMDTLVPKKAAQKQQGRKSDSMNITSPSNKRTSVPTKAVAPQKSSQRASQPKPPQDKLIDTVPTLDRTPSRRSRTDEDNLDEWSAELNSLMLEDEARRGVEKSGRMPTAKNTQRFKRDLRRERRKREDQDV